jgi:hypothetical protein
LTVTELSNRLESITLTDLFALPFTVVLFIDKIESIVLSTFVALPFAILAFSKVVKDKADTVTLPPVGGSGLLNPKKSFTIIVEALLLLVQIAPPPLYLFTILV